MPSVEAERECCYCCKKCKIIETEDGDIIEGECKKDGEKIAYEDLDLCICEDWEDDPERTLEFGL